MHCTRNLRKLRWSSMSWLRRAKTERIIRTIASQVTLPGLYDHDASMLRTDGRTA